MERGVSLLKLDGVFRLSIRLHATLCNGVYFHSYPLDVLRILSHLVFRSIRSRFIHKSSFALVNTISYHVCNLHSSHLCKHQLLTCIIKVMLLSSRSTRRFLVRVAYS